jgi:hypothetical protein
VKTTVFKFPRDATIATCGDFNSHLRAALLAGNPIVLDTSDLAAADLTCVQSLMAFGRAAADRGLAVRAQDPVSPVLLDALRRAGVSGADCPILLPN